MTTKRFLGYLKATLLQRSRTMLRRINRRRERTGASSGGRIYHMKFRAGIIAVPLLFLVAACAPVQPKPDPLREEVTILQKQLLELQKLQIETRARLEESSAAVNVLSSKIAAMEERQPVKTIVPANPPVSRSAVKVAGQPVKKTVSPKKKTAKKTINKVRRQE